MAYESIDKMRVSKTATSEPQRPKDLYWGADRVKRAYLGNKAVYNACDVYAIKRSDLGGNEYDYAARIAFGYATSNTAISSQRIPYPFYGGLSVQVNWTGIPSPIPCACTLLVEACMYNTKGDETVMGSVELSASEAIGGECNTVIDCQIPESFTANSDGTVSLRLKMTYTSDKDLDSAERTQTTIYATAYCSV